MAKKAVSAQRVVATSFIVDLSDVGLNIAAAVLSGSVVMLTEGLQGSADLLTSGLLWIGIKRARRRANKQYPFGFGRELFFWALMAGVSMFILTAGMSFYFGLQRFLNPQPLHNLGFAYFSLVIGLVTNLYAFNLSRRRLNLPFRQPYRALHNLRQSNLIESKSTLTLDAMGSTASFLGLIALLLYGLTGNSRFDGIGAMIVGIASAVFAVLLIVEVRDMITGRSATKDIEQQISATALSVEGVKKVLDLRTMVLGAEDLLVNIELHLDPTLTTTQIENLTDQVKARIKRSVAEVRHIQVEVETPGR
jgi:cation diffusion facilitator family transporter